ncbi:MAG: chemotaxis protein CheW [Oligoflexales bacterium]
MSLLDGTNITENESARSKKKHLIFSLSDKRYAFPLSRVKEVIGLTNITPLPKVPPFYKGLINLRGQIISVIDLRIKLGFQSLDVNSQKTSIIISHVGDIVVGSIVDEVLEVVGYDDSELEINLEDTSNRKGDGVYGIAKHHDGELTLLIDLHRSMNRTDFKVLKDQGQGGAA